MSALIKPLIVILFLASLSWWLTARVTPAALMARPDIHRLRNTWLGLTLLIFLSGKFMLFALVATVILVRLGTTLHPALVYSALLLAIPGFQYELSGFGPIQNLIDISFPRLLVWAVLIPALIRSRQQPGWPSFGHHPTDWVAFLPAFLIFGLQIQFDSFTNTLRGVIYFLSDGFWIYYGMSRLIRDRQDLMRAVWGFCIGIFAISLIAMFEFANRWLMYDALADILGTPYAVNYLLREGTGWLRAISSTGHPLVLGYVTAIAALLYLCMAAPQKPTRQEKLFRLMFLGGLMGALFASISRGMWVGFIAGYAAWLLTGPGATKKLTLAVVGALLVLGVASLTPSGEQVIQTLPFIGTADQENVVYRQRLLEVSWMVIQENFWLGSADYLRNPLMQSLVQGQGIIDIVNTFLGYALSSGVIGVSLFAGAFLFSMLGILKRLHQRRANVDDDLARMGRGLFSSLVATLVMISTTSSVGVIPMVYWMLMGLGVGFCFVHDREMATQKDRPVGARSARGQPAAV